MTSASRSASSHAAPEAGRDDLALSRRLLGYLKAHKRLFVVALLLYPIDAVSVVVPPYLVRQILDVVIPNRDVGLLGMYVGLYLGALALEYASGFLSQLAMSVLGQRSMLALRADLYAHAQKLPASYFDRNPIGRVLTRLTNDVEALSDVFATGAVTVLGDLVTVTAVVATMIWLDPRLTLFAFVVVPPLFGIVVLARVFARRAYRAIRLHLSRINTFLAEHLSAMSVVQIFGQEERTEREFHALNRDYRDANRSAIAVDAILFAIVEAFGVAAVAALLWWGAGDLAAGAVGAGTLVAFIQYIRRAFVPIRDLSTKFTVIQSGFAAAERCFGLLDTPVIIASPPAGARPSRLFQGIELSRVWFAYRAEPSERDWVLRDLSLKVTPGAHVALVGATGAGKSSILNLLTRFYDVQRGSVRIDGVDVRDVDLPSLRKLFAVVLQDVYLFSGTIMDNLTLSGSLSPETVRRAAHAVQAEAFISRLPQGYDTPVKQLGVNFSAGERQLLAFARAMALDPEVLILDEATSNVDSDTEARIQTALDRLLVGRTAIVVAHRLSTVRKLDRIVVLRQGQVVEEGSHEQLMARGGVYRRLVEVQFNSAAVLPSPATW